MKRGSKAVKISSEPSVVEQAGALFSASPPTGRKSCSWSAAGRWGLPQGHMDPGETSYAAAAREAFEEAGIRGTISKQIVGSFLYSKDSRPSRYRVIVHELSVTSVEDSYPETGVRAREWFSVEGAREIVGHDGLRTLLASIV